MMIKRVQRNTECLFAGQARIVSGPRWREDESFGQNMERQASALEGFARAMETHRYDGFCIEAPMELGATVAVLAGTVNRALRDLAAHAPIGGNCFDEPVETECWRFRFMKEVFFVIAFGSCYSEEHSRFSFGSDRTLILLQPDRAFSRHCPPGHAIIPERTRDRIRIAYAEAGRIYDLTHTLSPIEAHRFVKPPMLRCPPIRWWEQIDADRPAGLERDG